MADVVLCGAFQGSSKTKDGDSLPSHRVNPKPLPEGQEIQNGSSSSAKAFVVMGATNDLQASQIADDDLRKIIAWKESCHSRLAWKDVSIENKSMKTYWSQWDFLSLHNSVLCWRWELETGDEVRWQFVIPSNLRNDILHELHTMETAGHLSVNKRLERVKEKFYWPGCTKDMKDWCQVGDLCASWERPTRTPLAPLRTYNVGAPLEKVALDILGAFSDSDGGNKYILIIGDYFLTWTET